MKAEKEKELENVVTEEFNDNLQVVTEETPIPPEVVKEIKEQEPLKRYIINTVTPLTINKHMVSELKNVATLVFLCKGIIDDEEQLFTIGRNYVIDTEEQDMLIGCMPFYEEDAFVNTKIIDSYLISSLKSYYSTFNYTVDSNFNDYFNMDPRVVINATERTTDEEVEFEMSGDQFASIAFVESYIMEGIENEHDLALATVTGSKVSAKPATFFVIDTVEAIMSMTSTTRKESGIKGLFKKNNSTTIATVLKVSRFINEDQIETVYLLIPFDTGKVYPKSKFKNMTIEEIESLYYEHPDQYVSTLIIDNCKINGANDEEYLICRGKSKTDELILFLFNNNLIKSLNKMIEEY